MTLKVTRKLTELLLRDLGNGWDVGFFHPDRLTRAEAAEIQRRAKADPEIVKAAFDPRHPNHTAVKTFKAMVDYYATAHPQDATGNPMSWPDREPTGGVVTPENPFGDLNAEEAQSMLDWANTRPDFHKAMHDKSDPTHAALIEQNVQLHAIAAGAPAPPSPASAAGSNAAGIAEAMKDPAYLNPAHPDHKAAVQRVLAAYEAQNPAPGATQNPAPGAAPPAAAPANSPQELMKDPAYFNKAHPDHAAAVARVLSAYEAQPGTPGASAAAGAAPQRPDAATKQQEHQAALGRMAADNAKFGRTPVAAPPTAQALMADPAYRDGRHPGHRAAVDRVMQAMQAQSPAPGAPAGEAA